MRPGAGVARLNERRTAADFVAVVCALSALANGMSTALHDGAAGLSGPGADELRRAVDGRYVERDAPGVLDELATRWAAPCLASLAVAIRADVRGAMREYIVACAVADATGRDGGKAEG